MTANNEIGTVHDIAGLCAAVKAFNEEIIFHTDASQAVGKLSIDVAKTQVDLLTVAGSSLHMLAFQGYTPGPCRDCFVCEGHKIYAPKGVGALYISRRLAEQVCRIDQDICVDMLQRLDRTRRRPMRSCVL